MKEKFQDLRLFFVFAGIFFGLLFFVFPAEATDTSEVYPVRVHVFYSEGCPHCRDEFEFLEKIGKALPHVEILEYEVSKSFQNQNIFTNIVKRYEFVGGVPTTIIGEEALVGFDRDSGIGQKIISLIAKCSVEACDGWIDEVTGSQAPSTMQKIKVKEKVVEFLGIGNVSSEENQNSQTETVRVFGREICLESASSTCVLGVILGLADGINPCMFSVLLFLLTYLLAIGSRKRALKAGLVFAVTTFVIYFIFMLGLIKIVDVLQLANWFRKIIIVISFVVGIIMIKDFFWYSKWISLDIPKKFRPKLRALIRKGTVPSTIVLAIFASIVELPCTSGLPLVYVSILAQREQSPILYLAFYNLFFILPLLVIMLFVAFAWAKTEKLEEKRVELRKYMRLVAGILLLILALALWQNWI